jgi:HNH endonuclease/NUMOD4 motif
MVEEIWKSIALPGFEDLYEASNLGRLRRTATGRLLKQANHPKGYLAVMFSGRGQRQNALVHKVVLEAFEGRCPEGHETRHLDGNRKNNVLTNLAWGTSSENEQDKRRHGTSSRGERNAMASLSTEDVREIISRYNAGESQRALASVYGVHQPQISRIVNGKRWGHLK